MEKIAEKLDRKKSETGTLLDIEDLHVYYDTVNGTSRAVDGVNLSIRRGEILGIAGESGCGKSTLTTALLRMTRRPGYIAGGSIYLHLEGQDSINLLELGDEELRAVRWRNLAYLPQGSMSALNPVLRIKEQFLDVMLEHSSITKREAEKRIPDLLQQVNLESYVARMYPHELSGGMKQRVTLAMAIALNPDLLIADEPTTALDVHVQRVIIQLLADLRERLGMTMVVVTHDMAVHAELVDRVAVMYAGGIVEAGDVRQIFKDPKHPYTQALINSIPRVGGERTRLAGIGGNTPSPRNWPSGCRFHPRCPHVMPVCSKEAPALITVSDGLNKIQPPAVSCHLYTQAGSGGRYE